MSIKPYKNEVEEESVATIKPFKEESFKELDISLDIEHLEEQDVVINKSINFFGSLGSVFVGIFAFVFLAVLASAIASIQDVFASKNLSDYIYFGGLLLLLIVLFFFTFENIKEFFALKRVTEVRAEFKEQKNKPDANIIPLAHFIINKYENSEHKELKESVDALREELNSSLIYENIYSSIDDKILSSIDKLAKTTIHKASIQGALATAISPVPIIDMALVVWRSAALTKDIASLYGFKPGMATTLILLKRGLINIMFAGISELANEFANQVASSSFLGKASRSLGQGAINGILIARLGYGVLEACRPIESHQGKTSFFTMLFNSIKEALRS